MLLLHIRVLIIAQLDYTDSNNVSTNCTTTTRSRATSTILYLALYCQWQNESGN